jgi:hypothetical protein
MSRRFGVALALAAIASACGGVVDPSKNQTETFTGTIQPGSGNFGGPHTVNVTKSGEINVTVTSLTPSLPSGTFFIIGFGQSVSGQCSINIQVNQFAIVGSAAINGPISPGSYCVVIADEGFFTVAEDYTMKVSHP